MREIGSSVRFLRDKFVPLYSERGYSDKDIRNKEVLALFSCGFVPFLSRQNFVSWCKILQVADLKRLVRMIKGRISLTTSNHQNGPCEPVKVASHRNSLVWNITSSISSSRMSMPKSDKILSAIHYWILEDVSVCSVSISCTGNMPSAFSKSWINSLPFCVHRVRITVLPFSNWEVSLPTYPFPL